MQTAFRGRWIVVAAVLLAVAAIPFQAQQAKRGLSTLDDLVFVRPEVHIIAQPQPFAQVRVEASPAVAEAYDQFLTQEGQGRWHLLLDRVTGRPALMEGAGVPWIPGTANGLRPDSLGLAPNTAAADVPISVVAGKALEFIRSYPDLLGVDPADLVLRPGASGPIADYLYFVDFQWTYHGIPVEGARVVFRLNHGNLVQVGEENICDSISKLDWVPTMSAEAAWDSLWGYAGGEQPGDKVESPARLEIIPVQSKTAFGGDLTRPGTGMSYRLIYVMSFSRPGVLGTWEGKVDAHTGELLSFRDVNDYGKVHGGVYPFDHVSPEADRPMPYADLGGGNYADARGFFAGSSATSTLGGKYVDINEHCGSISNSTASGDLDFGSSGGTDCTTPGIGGSGNTHAARNAFYQINLVKEKARTYMPANAWLNGNLAVETDISPYCNSFANGAGLHFYKAVAVNPPGTTCANTGELGTVVDHEFGHNLDSNDGGGFSPDMGTAESYADTTFILQFHSSCIGNNLYTNPGGPIVCGGYGNTCTSCSGWRDMNYANHADPTPSVPSMLDGSTGYRCGLNAGYPGPCGYEGHCESVIITQAIWDLATRDLPALGMDQASAWEQVDKLWYRSRSTAGAAYSCPALNNTDGCGAGSVFSVFRVADDCDGDLSNGTPHASAIYAAFNRHAIACNSVVNTNQNCCGAIGTPTVSTTLGTNSVTVHWTAASGAVTYDVYRNELSCSGGYTRIATTNNSTFSLVDNGVVGGVTYYYRVQAVGSSAACAGAMSNCSTVGGPLSASTSVVPMSGTVPLLVNFSTTGVNGTPPYTSYAWDFGDGGTAVGTSAAHLYTSTGTFFGSMTVKDSGTPQATYVQPFSIVVTCPVITVSPPTIPTLVAGTYYSIPFSASGGTSPYTFTEFGALPSGMSFSGGTLSGTPVVVGDFPISVTAKDTYNCTGTTNYTLHIICPVITLSPASMPGCVKGQFFSKTLTASGGIGSYTYQVTAGSLPPGLTLSSGGVLSGTATATGTWTFTVTALDVNLCPGTATYTFSVFDIAFWDDYGGAAFCVTFSSGQYAWTILTGPHAGTTYSGIAHIFNGGAKITSMYGDPNYFSMTYDPVRKRAYGWLVSGGVYSRISDSNTTNDPGGCS